MTQLSLDPNSKFDLVLNRDLFPSSEETVKSEEIPKEFKEIDHEEISIHEKSS